MDNKKEKTSYLVFGIIFITFTAVILTIFSFIPTRDATALVPTPKTEETAESPKNTGTVSIPGFESLTLQSGKIRQKLVFFNPAENNCYFRISLILPDETVIWESALIPPGMQTEYIDLIEPVEAGTYDGCALVYSVFADKGEKEALNGAKTVLTVFAR